jgi:hypothetical protein
MCPDVEKRFGIGLPAVPAAYDLIRSQKGPQIKKSLSHVCYNMGHIRLAAATEG